MFVADDETNRPLGRPYLDGEGIAIPFYRGAGKNLLFYVLGAYICQMLIFAVFGMGWAWGDSQSWTGRNNGQSDSRWVLGSSVLYVSAGDQVAVHYDLALRKGCLQLYLQPFPFGDANQNGEQDVFQSGVGDVVLTAKQSGLVQVASSTKMGCVQDRSVIQGSGGSYTLTWHGV